MKLLPTPPSAPLRFGALKFTLDNMNGEDEKGILSTLERHFPAGTEVVIEDLFCGETSDVQINGPSEEAEQKIGKALDSAGFKTITVSPFQLTPKQKRIGAGLDILKG
jgi:hypothetical protein